MEELIKVPYEISVWQDIFMTGTYDTSTKEVVDYTQVIEGDTYSTFSYIKEKKLAIIGSDTMDSPARALEPNLTRNVNGTVTLKFDIYDSYYDEDEGKIILNPYKSLLINEAKIKMKYDDEWYDLIIKDINQDLESRKSSITASSLFINELSKNGFNITLDTELSNNIGTITDLATTILDGSDWTVDNNSDTLSQTSEEALLKVTTIVPLTAYTIRDYFSDEKSSITLPAGTIFYAFYSSLKNIKSGDSSQLQIAYHANGVYNVDDNYVIKEDSVSIYDNQFYIDGINYVENSKTYQYNDTVCFSEVTIEYEELYRADRLILASNLVYEPISERSCYKYTFDVDEHCWATIDCLSGIPLTSVGFNEQSFLTNYYSLLKPYFLTQISVTEIIDGYVPDFDCFKYFNKEDSNGGSVEAGTYTITGTYGADKKWHWVLDSDEILLEDYGIYYDETKIKQSGAIHPQIIVTKKNDRSDLLFNIRAQVIINDNQAMSINWFITNQDTLDFVPIDGSALGFTINSYTFALADDGDSYVSGTYEGSYEVSVVKKDKKLAQEGYMYLDNEFITSSALCNYIGDGDTFTNSDNWDLAEGTIVPIYTIYPALEDVDGEDKKTFRDFIYFYSDNVYYSKLTNVFTNYKSSGFVEGEDYILRLSGGSANISSRANYHILDHYPTEWQTSPFSEIVICDYRVVGKAIYPDYNYSYVTFTQNDEIDIDDYDYSLTKDTERKAGKKYFIKDESGKYSIFEGDTIPDGAYESTTFNPYINYTGKCTQSLPKSNIYSGLRERDDNIWRIGLFILTEDDCAVESIQLFDCLTDSDGKTCALGSVPESTEITNYEYFYLADGAISEDDIISVKSLKEKWEDTQDGIDHNVTLVRKSNPFEKIRTVSATQSNRFNLIQQLCETFQCWARFTVPHKENGELELYWDTTKTVPEYSPIKKITFKEKIGSTLGYGFKYGFNLKSMSRTINSDSLVTKLIVSANSNEHAKNGFCTIQRSSYNDTKQSYILNFNYYIQHDMLSYEQIYKDFYNDGAYFDQLTQSGDNIEEAVNERSSATNNLTNLQSSYKTYNDAITAGLETKTDALESLKEFFIGLEVPGAEDMNEYQLLQTSKTYMDPLTENYSETVVNLYMTCKQMDIQMEIYTVRRNSLTDSIQSAKSRISILDEKITNFKKISTDIQAAIYKKYYRFIQEGTWQSEDYYDDDLYYIDAKDVLGTSSIPQVSYNISVIDLKNLTDYSNMKFDLGDVSFVQDPDFFGYTRVHGAKTPYKEEVVISEITEYPESPESNTIKIQNFKTQFEDLFQRITATTQSLQYASGGYNRATKAIQADGSINSSILQNSLSNNGDISITNSASQSNTYGDNGLISTNLLNNNNQLRILNGEISKTSDGGINWKSSDALIQDKINATFVVDGDKLYIKTM